MKHGGQLCEHLKSHEQSDNEQRSGKHFGGWKKGVKKKATLIAFRMTI
jgi:hypothetical protein